MLAAADGDAKRSIAASACCRRRGCLASCGGLVVAGGEAVVSSRVGALAGRVVPRHRILPTLAAVVALAFMVLLYVDAFYKAQLLATRSVDCVRWVAGGEVGDLPPAGGPQGEWADAATRTAPGACPPDGTLCTPAHVFDLALVLTIPARPQWARTEPGLRAAGLSYIVFHGADLRQPAMRRHHTQLRCHTDTGLSAGEFAFSLSWLAMLRFVLSTNATTVLILEDDVILQRDFGAAFDARMRAVPPDWDILFLGASQDGTWVEGEHVAWPPGAAPFHAPTYRPLLTSGTYAIALHRRVIPYLLERIGRLDCAVDTCAISDYLTTCASACHVMFPNIVIADVRQSDLRGGADAAAYARRCHWPLDDFDLPPLRPGDSGSGGGDGGGGGVPATSPSAPPTTSTRSTHVRRLAAPPY